jgi:hypothetical protein
VDSRTGKIIEVRKHELPLPLVVYDERGNYEIQELAPAGKKKAGRARVSPDRSDERQRAATAPPLTFTHLPGSQPSPASGT